MHFRILAFAFLVFVAPLPAATHLVKNGLDSFQSPPEGSLRHVIETLAQPGDTIKFETPVIVVNLADSLVVKASLTGLRIEGPGQIGFKAPARDQGTAMLVEADGVTITNLRIRNCFIDASTPDAADPITGLTVSSCIFSGRSGVVLKFTDGARIESNQFLCNNSRVDDEALSSLNTTNTVIATNTFTMARGGGINTAFDTNLEVRSNTSNAPFFLSLRGGTVKLNVVEGRSVTVLQELQEAPIVVEDNRCGMMRVFGVALTVRRNVVRGDLFRRTNYDIPSNKAEAVGPPVGALSVAVGLSQSQDPFDGPITVSDNETTGGLVGLSFSQRVETPQTDVFNNKVHRALLQGMSLRVTTAAHVFDNEIDGCTGRARGPRAALLVFEGTEDLRIESNDLLGNRINSLAIFPGATATVKGNTIKNGFRHGIAIAGGASVVAENNTIEACKVGGIFLDPFSAATLKGNTIKKTAGPGIVVAADAVLSSTNDTVEENAGAGVLVRNAGSAVLTHITTRNNLGAGVSLLAGAEAQISGGSFFNNRAAGIDLAPVGVSLNIRKKLANGDIDYPFELEFDGSARLIRGKAEPGALIELFRTEAGTRRGNPKNGEGVMFVGTTIATGNGEFAIAPGPTQEGDLFCLTATRPGTQPLTSEFSENIAIPPSAPVERVNVSSNEAQAEGVTVIESAVATNLSDNGRFVVFSSTAANLVNDDTNGGLDIFVRDLVDGTTERVSVNSAGEQSTANGVPPSASSPSISADGRYVVFGCSANNFVPGVHFDSGFIALRDRQLGTTIGVTDPAYFDDTRPVQSQYRGQGFDPCISADGSVVAFMSTDGAFVDEDTNTGADLFVWTRATGAYERISVTSAGGQMPSGTNWATAFPRLSADGRFVAFQSAATLVPGNTADGVKVYLRDRTSQTTELISLTAGGAAVAGHSPSISRDGRFVAFVTSVSLDAADTNSTADIYIRDRQTGAIEFCSRKPNGTLFLGNAKMPFLSGNGRYLAFCGPGQSDSGGFIVLHDDLFVLDRQTGTVVEAGIGISGEALGACLHPSLSLDGRFMSFKSQGANLVENDTNDLEDLFLRNRSAELGPP
jgi:Tol biopolymer transport system component